MQNCTLIAVTIAVLAVAPIGAQARRFPDSYAGIGSGALSYKAGSNVASVARLSAVEFSPISLRLPFPLPPIFRIGRFPEFYVGIGYGAFSYRVGSYNVASIARLRAVESSPISLRGIFGFDMGKHMSLECLFQTYATGNTITKQGVIGGYDVDVASGASSTRAWYLRGTTKLGENFEGFARVGRATTHLDVTISYDTNNYYQVTKDFSRDYSSLSWGLGVNYALDKRLTVDIDYMSYLDYENKYEVHTIAGTTISLVYQL